MYFVHLHFHYILITFYYFPRQQRKKKKESCPFWSYQHAVSKGGEDARGFIWMEMSAEEQLCPGKGKHWEKAGQRSNKLTGKKQKKQKQATVDKQWRTSRQ